MFRSFQNLWTTEIPRALCLTFLHSLWQGLLLALLAAFMLLLSPKAKPRLRYNMLALLFAGFVALVAGTFILSFRHTGPIGFASPERAGNKDTGISTLYTLWDNTLIFINTYSGYLFILWLVAFGIKSFRLLQDISGLNLLRKTGTPVQDTYWTARLQELQSRLHIRGLVKLRESARLKSPSVSGILKPVILVPLGMFSQLPQDQIEAILLHELAHIRRKDYLFNLVQTVLESIFFFNPFLYWLSASLRAERENCCDELAIDVTQNKTALVKALLSFSTQQATPGDLAMALSNTKTLLLDRVKRIAFDKNKSLNSAEKSFLALFSIAILTFLCTFSWNVQQQLSGKNNPSYNQLLQHKTPRESAPPEPLKLLPADIKPAAPKQCGSKTTIPISFQQLSLTTTQTTTITTLNNPPGTDTLALNQNILTDLEQAGIAANTAVQSYRLTDLELIVNGIKQPESLHQKLKSKYVTGPGWAILYDFHSCS